MIKQSLVRGILTTFMEEPGTYAKKLPKGEVVNFGKFENYFSTFRFEFLGPGSFSKILKSNF